MSGTEKSSTTRRNLLQTAAVAGASTALLGGLGINPALAAAARSEKPLKAAFSNAGLQATWCAQGKQARIGERRLQRFLRTCGRRQGRVDAQPAEQGGCRAASRRCLKKMTPCRRGFLSPGHRSLPRLSFYYRRRRLHAPRIEAVNHNRRASANRLQHPV